MSTLNFRNAVDDYRLLKNKLYPDKAALKLIGDRYRLSTVARNCLLRGVVKKDTAVFRKAKIINANTVKNKKLGIDWYNVLITVESYLKGGVLFLADDGLLRDSSAVHGSYRPGHTTERAIDSICDAFVCLSPQCIDIYIDSPISHSKKMLNALEKRLLSINHSFAFSLTLVASADFALKAYSGIVASSDSVIIDTCNSVIDLPRYILATTFSFQPVSLYDLEIN